MTMETNFKTTFHCIVFFILAALLTACGPGRPEDSRVRETLKLQVEKEGCLVLTDFVPNPSNEDLRKDQTTYTFEAIVGILEPSNCSWEGGNSPYSGYDSFKNFNSSRMSSRQKENSYKVMIAVYFETRDGAWQMTGYKFKDIMRDPR
jgi:hypothetical protein